MFDCIICVGGFVVCQYFVLCAYCFVFVLFFFFKQKTAYEMRISDWSSDVCSSDLLEPERPIQGRGCNGPGPPWQARRRPGFQRLSAALGQIGRASCRERVCQYV